MGAAFFDTRLQRRAVGNGASRNGSRQSMLSRLIKHLRARVLFRFSLLLLSLFLVPLPTLRACARMWLMVTCKFNLVLHPASPRLLAGCSI